MIETDQQRHKVRFETPTTTAEREAAAAARNQTETPEVQQCERRQSELTTTAAPTVVERPKTGTTTSKWERGWCGCEGLVHHR
ncbi:hypothetical protein L195_g017391 [Trifolium pratense]|uniref:Uncharacterized protein n=1 Tax=Trifolium pratense TaxID=57577 RepID=A0A2K3MTS5_TRIPR|nr:hypothetical protein L195_g017391 [Trifolium pratense]